MQESDTASKTFLGVRFCLYGFDPINEHKVRVKLVDNGGVGVGQYSRNCTHLIVDKIVYDDPLCVAARNDGKTVITGLWVDHSFDVGMPVDATSIMYRPIRDLSGIPGAKSLVVCLTGYQRQDREDIMTMVSLMGAQFLNLWAAKINFSMLGLYEDLISLVNLFRIVWEKYELAKKIKKIKLINHLWLEDCLREWEILSEANYSKSGYELEVMEAEAKDSDEEAEETTMKHFGQQSLNRSPPILRSGMLSSIEMPTTVEVSIRLCPDIHRKPRKDVSSIKPVQPDNGSPSCANMDNKLASTSRSPSLSNQMFTAISYSKKSPRTATPPNLSREVSCQSMKIKGVSDISSSKMQQLEEGTSSCLVRSPQKGSDLCHGEDSAGILPQKRALKLSGSSTKSQKLSRNAKASVKGNAEQWELTSLLSTDLFSSKTVTPEDRKNSSAEKSPSTSFSRGSTLAGKPNMQNEIAHVKSPKMSLKGLRESTSASRSNIRACNPERIQVVGEPDELLNKQQDVEVPSLDYRKLLNENSHSPSNLNLLGGGNDKLLTKLVSKPDMQNENAYEKSPQAFFKGLRESTSASKSNIGEYGLEPLRVVEEPGELQNKQQDVEVPSHDEKNLGNENSHSPSNIDLLEGGNEVEHASHDFTQHGSPIASEKITNETDLERAVVSKDSDFVSQRMLMRWKMKRSVMPHPVAKPKGSTAFVEVEISGAAAPDEEDNNDPKKTAEKEKSELIGLTRKAETFVDVEHVGHDSIQHGSPIALENRMNVMILRRQLVARTPTLYPDECEETENETKNVMLLPAAKPKGSTASSKVEISAAPDEEDENYGKKTAENEKPELIELTHKTETFVEVEHVSHDSIQHGSPIALDNRTNETDPEKTVGSNNSDFDVKCGSLKKKASKREKQPSSRAMMKADPSNSKNDLVGENSSVRKNVEETKYEKENVKPHPAPKPKGRTASKVEISGATDESSPVHDKEIAGKSVCKPNSKTLRTNENSQKVDSNREPLQKVLNRVKNEPLCFILSGHRLQRKEFQQVIRGLKGKFCRDSHQWSYQATHFIAPDPIRRTENSLLQLHLEGKFLAEEPYEWHKNGLTEDGAINLEAPRKWRQLRERTSHGAFYGMRIIVYGECIAPPLVCSIFTWLPFLNLNFSPYTRFLKSGVDFAVVSPSMPRVDMWVQEFFKHEVPCIVADYLVGYACKPGYSLERHVLYNTHEWAERSFTTLTSRMEEIVEDLTPESPNDSEGDDITCQVCGSGDRGVVMLICGDENGSIGCGIGTHIDCCDPPLDVVPEEDWFCPKCVNITTSSKKGKKAASRSKG
ncbi:Heat shock protein DnaJ with tetratricopeptide repeat isoform 1 [Hibiscus syriacus]|uniref:Heat shock protein DnaJ with tetratricopeptide repeat isoform 1 n=1 Tax=Hibiscus syriacus TaxID=106335 RepID=A0A6A2XE41_HIBSY|nr:Heat shock protein DnaJ with tetratricopeptide repeat isoform 1 [Hibiscus syriacus]